MGDSLKLDNFSLSEMNCRDGSPVPAQYEENAYKVLSRLQVIRDFFDKPVRIRSGYRSPEHNKAVGGEDRSYHLTASAADFTVEGYSPSQVRDALEGLIRVGALPNGGIGSYLTFTHYDLGPRRRWRK